MGILGRFSKNRHTTQDTPDHASVENATAGIALGIYSIVADRQIGRIEGLLNPPDSIKLIPREKIEQIADLVQVYYIASFMHVLNWFGKSKPGWLNVLKEFESLVFTTHNGDSGIAQTPILVERVNRALKNISKAHREDWSEGSKWIGAILIENQIEIFNPIDIYIVFEMIQSNIRVVLKALPTLEDELTTS